MDQPAPTASRPSRALLFIALALFLAGLVVAIIAVVYRPDYVVLAGMDDAELRWFRPRIDRFAEEHHVRLALVPWKDAASLTRALRDDAHRPHPRVLLAEAPDEALAGLADSSAILALPGALGDERYAALADRFHALALASGKVAGTPYALPARVTTLCLYYSKAHVADAHAHWAEHRAQIESWLKEANGVGLPGDFTFEEEPSQWDSYDVFVAAAYWAMQEDGGVKVARLAHVVAPPGGLAFDLSSRAFAMGAQGDELLAVGGDRLADALAWESVLFAHGLYHPAMVREHWTAHDIAAAVAQGQVWMAFLDPRDVFRLHGLPGQDGFVKDAADLGVAPMPRGESLLMERRSPARWGDPLAARGGLGWVVPAHCPDHALAADLLRALSDEAASTEAATTLGWFPPYADTPGQLDLVYRDPHLFEIGRVALRQAYDFGRPLPGSPRASAAAAALNALWEQAAVRDHVTAPLALEEALRRAMPRD